MKAPGSTVSRPAVDVAPRRTHAGLAFVLGLLSIPGCTLAWDLPAGGLWIGLPLGIAAIVLGVRARREPGSGSTLATAGIVLATLAIGQMVVYSAVLLVT